MVRVRTSSMLRTGEAWHALQHFVPVLAVPRHADIGLVVGIADPGDLANVELALAHQRLERDAALDGGDRAAILGRDVDHEVDQPSSAGAGHVLHHDGRIAGQMLAEMAADEACIGFVRAAGAGTDIEVDVLAAAGDAMQTTNATAIVGW